MTNSPAQTANMTESIVGPDEGWSLVEVLDWLLTDRAQIAGADDLVTQLGNRLVDAGAPVWRLRFNFRTIHPQIVAWGVIWVRGAGSATETRGRHGVQDTAEYIGSPVQYMNETGKAFRRRLTDLSETDDQQDSA